MFFEKIKEILCKGIELLKKVAKKLLNILKGEKTTEEPKKYVIDHGDYGNASYVNEYKQELTIDHGMYEKAKAVKKKEYVKNANLTNNKPKLEQVAKNVKINHGMYEFNSLR